MKIRDYRTHFIGQLASIYDRDEAESFFYLVLEDFTKLKRTDLALNPGMTFSDDETSKWDVVCEKLRQEIPIQYILGRAHFYGLEFAVGPEALIPRPETEELVDWIISDVRKSGLSKLKVLDIGTGSGCIAISLAKNLPTADVAAIDVSEKALALAKQNAASNKVQVNFLHQDILATGSLAQDYEIIVSNPPYVRHLEKHEIRKNVLDNEPHLALFVSDDDALLFYRKIAQLALENLTADGRLYFEINQYLAKETMDMLETMGFGFMELRKDIYGNDRMILAKR
jgi:release factor glutamine methyltransferase